MNFLNKRIFFEIWEKIEVRNLFYFLNIFEFSNNFGSRKYYLFSQTISQNSRIVFKIHENFINSWLFWKLWTLVEFWEHLFKFVIIFCIGKHLFENQSGIKKHQARSVALTVLGKFIVLKKVNKNEENFRNF